VKENLYLYGAIYRINRPSIRAKLDDILEWAELTDFVNAQLKTLSSGMKTRLAFSIMRHIEADIFLLDEALTAGDKNFQTKCDQFFEECKQRETTFLVSTHNHRFAQSFCSKTIWLHKGEILAFGDTSEVLKWYEEGSAQFLKNGIKTIQ
jgi:lipopolysaccharide transport system ATP-binding protein